MIAPSHSGSISGHTGRQRARLIVPLVVIAVLMAVVSHPVFATSEEDKLLPDLDGPGVNTFSWALTLDGDTLAVGTPDDDQAGVDAGAVYLFERSSQGWEPVTKLIASDAQAGERFGGDIDLEGDTLVVGAWTEPLSAYVFTRSAGEWAEQEKLVPSASAPRGNDPLAVRVATSAGRALIGSPHSDPGAVYVFAFDGSSWTEEATLTASDGGTGDRFGFSAAVHGTTVVVGSRAAAYIFDWDGSSWTESAKLIDPDGELCGVFGRAVDIHLNTVVVGETHCVLLEGAGTFGWVHVFVSSESGWTPQARLPEVDEGYDDFGTSLSLQGDLVLVGARHAIGDGGRPGAAYVYERQGESWSEIVKLPSPVAVDNAVFGHAVALDGTTVSVSLYTFRSVYTYETSGWTDQGVASPWDTARDDGFGTSVDIEGTTVVVGSPGDDDRGLNAGSAYVFVESGGSWTRAAELHVTESDHQHDEFGKSVAVSGGRILVGAPGDDNGSGLNAGSAYVFVGSGSAWALEDQLLSSDLFADGQRLGTSVAIEEARAVVGAPGLGPGSAYVFEWDGSSWTEVAKLTPSDGSSGDRFGTSVALQGDLVVVGAFAEDEMGPDAGATYVFRQSGTSWVEEAKLTASDGDLGDFLGTSVAVNGNTILAGAPGDDDLGTDSGSAYIFSGTNGSWVEQAKISANDGSGGDLFGITVSLGLERAAVGAKWASPSGVQSGSAYLFSPVGGTWQAVESTIPTDGAPEAFFGTSMVLDGDRLVVGAPGDSERGPLAGAAYVFIGAGGPVAGDLTISGTEDQSTSWAPQVVGSPPISCAISTAPTHGTASVSPDCSGGSYVPDPNYYGPDEFTYEVSDGGTSDAGTVSVFVQSVNDRPSAGDVDVVGNEDDQLDWSPDVTDVDGDSLSCAIVTAPAHGSATVNANCSLGTYTPDPGFHGSDGFTYGVSDGSLDDTGSVSVTVEPVNDAPMAGNVSAEGDEDSQIPWSPAVSDADGDPLSCSIATVPTHGLASVQPDCSAGSYTPDAGFSGSDGFAYQVSDGSLSDTGAVSITVNPVESGNTFVDDDDSVFESDIEWLAAEGITKGCNPPTNDRFCPNDFVTRGQMAAFLARAFQLTDTGGGDLYIDDDDSIFETDIDKLGTAGITKGCNPPTNDRFCPDDFVTRGQMAAFLKRGLTTAG